MIGKHPSSYKREKSADKPSTSPTHPHSLPIFYTPRQSKPNDRALKFLDEEE